MIVLWLQLLIVFTLALFARHFSTVFVLNDTVTLLRPNKFLTFFIIAAFVLVSGLRSDIGDTFFYMYAFEITNYSLQGIDLTQEAGFYLYQMLLKGISTDPQILIFVSALITNTCIILALYKYCSYFELGVYVYFTSGLYLVSMNGMRQFLAAAILFLATRYLVKGQWFPYFLIILLASTIHQSALILLPTYFIVRRTAWSVSTILLLMLMIPLFLGYGMYSEQFLSLLSGTKYENYQSFAEGGSSLLRMMVAAAPVVLAYLGRERLKEIWPEYDYFVNMSILNTLVLLMATQNWIFARFVIYFGLYQVVLLSWIIHVFEKKEQKLVYGVLVFLYLLFCIYEQALSLNIVYRSNFIKW